MILAPSIFTDAAAAAPDPAAGERRGANADSLRILVVEDSAFDLELLKGILRNFSRAISITAVDSRPAFLAELGRQLPHLILSDYSLPGFDGIQALRIAQQVAPGVPFIFVTGTLGEEVAIEMLKQGATDYVLKTRPLPPGPRGQPSPPRD